MTDISVPENMITYDKKGAYICDYTGPFCRMSGASLYKKIGEKYVIDQ